MEDTEKNVDLLVSVASARRPLLGRTILLVEDSRYCSEAIRLLCQHSGARLRRADSLRAARRHLASYRPAVVIVDLGLPDGSGLEIIEEVAAYGPNAPVIIGLSGEDPNVCGPAALAVGANSFIAKPLKNIEQFQAAILAHLPNPPKLNRKNVISLTSDVTPDTLALQEDLDQIANLMLEALAAQDKGSLIYAAQFLNSVAEIASDQDLQAAAEDLKRRLTDGFAGQMLARRIVEMIGGRLQMLVAV